MAVLESGDLKGKKIGIELAHLARGADGLHVRLPLIRPELRREKWPTRSPRTREARVPGVWRAGRVEPGEAEAGLPVLRHRVAVPDRSRAPARSPSSISSPRCASCPDDERGWQTERRSVQCQSCRAVMVFDAGACRTELRVLRLAGARRLRRNQGADSSAGRAAVSHRHQPRARRHPPLVAQQVVRARPPGEQRRSSTPSTASTFPYWTFDAKVHCPWDAEAGHYYYVNVEGRDSKGRRVVRRNGASAGNRRRAWSITSSTMSRCRGRRGCRSILLRQVEPFPTGECVPYDTAFLSGHVVEHYQGGAARRGEAVAGADARQARGLCARSRCPAIRTAICRSTRRSRAGRSSTSSCRSGC